ncbi:YncE family protein [Algibacter pacificus]|uniref:YncE family protein n=1 Tax=Algibacter pacificus TaxID=2599389 RepID=UPI001FE2AB99|nr:YncE family protein [Algibacter pacificus]
MKRLKYSLIAFIVLGLVVQLFIFKVRLPSYSIQTSGKLYIVNKVSEDVQVFDLFSGKEIAKIPIDMLSHEAVITKNQNSMVLTNYELNEGNIVKVINTKTNKLQKTIALKENIKANGITAYPEPNKVAVIDYVRDTFFVLNIQTDSIEKQIETKQKKSHLVVMHPTIPMAYVTNVNSSSVSVIDLKMNKVVKIIPCGLGRKGIDITPDGSELWVSNVKERSITIINTSTYDVVDTLTTGHEPLKLKFSIDGKYCLLANAHDGTIYVYNQQSKQKLKSIMLHGKNTLLERILYHTPRPVNILMHPNGLYAFVSNSNANKIEVIDMKTFKVVSTIGTGKVPDAMAFVE